MAWNGSDGIAAHDQPRRTTGVKRLGMRKVFLLAFLLVAVFASAILVARLVLRNPEKPSESNLAQTRTHTVENIPVPRQRQRPSRPVRETLANDAEDESPHAAKNAAAPEGPT